MTPQPVMTSEEVTALLRDVFPQAFGGEEAMTVTSVSAGEAIVLLKAGDSHLRPGGTVSGPTLFTLFDLAAYVLVLSHVGPKALAVTTNATLNFLVKPRPGPLRCVCRLLKLGKRLVVCDAQVLDEEDRIVAQASLTYSVPPRADLPKSRSTVS